ncbi:MAG: succinylglutamate desuccinylase/aspartoacylase family protein [Verrucomicrobiales bacterium]|nr:succinylglutamate desuccinylase/aspartoacylase family protein [Verrucomicrobiales bacterium]
MESRSKGSKRFRASPLFRRNAHGEETELLRYLYIGPHGGGDAIRIGIFAGIHGDEPAGPHAIHKLIGLLEANPTVVQGYQLFLYPICNPTGFAAATRLSRSGKDLNREFWRNSSEPEVVLLEEEIRSRAFHGLISLHADDTSDGIYGFVRGAVLTRALLEPALAAAEVVLPRNTAFVIDGFSAENGIISECYDGILASPPELHPQPFEIILETPQDAPLAKQTDAFIAAIRAILIEYQKFLAFAANL